MGCICSKGAPNSNGYVESLREKEFSKSSKVLVAPSKREEIVVEVDGGGSYNGTTVRLLSKPSSIEIVVSIPVLSDNGGEKKPLVNEKPMIVHHQRRETSDNGVNLREVLISRIVSMPRGVEGEQAAAGWPSWVTAVAAEAIKGWVPRKANSFEKLDTVFISHSLGNLREHGSKQWTTD